MAQLNTSESNKSGKKIRSKKVILGVDLTAMVDLAFLLITFFMLTTSLAKQNALKVDMPVGENESTVPDNRSLTICLAKNNQIMWYRGTLENPIEKPAIAGYGKKGIRKVLSTQQSKVLAETNSTDKGLVVLIKPSDKSNYQNLVDMLDEMSISQITRYSIADIQESETDLLKKEKIY
jgi:biopolymer transport protein ExbD